LQLLGPALFVDDGRAAARPALDAGRGVVGQRRPVARGLEGVVNVQAAL
jgi:hypothetical protein